MQFEAETSLAQTAERPCGRSTGKKSVEQGLPEFGEGVFYSPLMERRKKEKHLRGGASSLEFGAGTFSRNCRTPEPGRGAICIDRTDRTTRAVNEL